jgi:hypothetical protein
MFRDALTRTMRRPARRTSKSRRIRAELARLNGTVYFNDSLI